MKKFILIACFSVLTMSGFAQAVVLPADEAETYYTGTIWGPEMRHYSYYFVRYAMAAPFEGPVAEMPLASGNWAAGLSYKLKLLEIWDIGIDLAYENEFHRLKNLSNTRSLVPELSSFDMVRTYQNNLMGGLYNRFYFKRDRVRDFGWYVDLGGYYSYVANFGTYYKENSDTQRVKIRMKKYDGLNDQNYGAFFRFGYNQFALYARYNVADVFSNNTANLSHLSIGIQLNLVMF
ncbi:MAG TPA: hypothetical protein PLA77_06870 [Bacteroidales bacterium]|nr:hypothetical protein [Bacteroidales bacterium]